MNSIYYDKTQHNVTFVQTWCEDSLQQDDSMCDTSFAN